MDLKVEKHGLVTLFTLNRPQRKNAISADLAIALQKAFQEFEQSEQRVAVITGEGDAFCSGADTSQLPELWRGIPGAGVGTSKPFICAIAGWCIGGGMILPIMSDLVVVADNAKFQYPEARLGYTGGFIAGLAARIPHKMAMEVMLLGETIGAQRAYEVGFVNRVVPLGQQVPVAMEMAQRIAASAPLVVRAMKDLVGETLPKSPSEQRAAVNRRLEVIDRSADGVEGVAAWREKREPRFTGS